MLGDPGPHPRRHQGGSGRDVEGGEGAAAGSAGIGKVLGVCCRNRNHDLPKGPDAARHLAGKYPAGSETHEKGPNLDRRSLTGDDCGEGLLGLVGRKGLALGHFLDVWLEIHRLHGSSLSRFLRETSGLPRQGSVTVHSLPRSRVQPFLTCPPSHLPCRREPNFKSAVSDSPSITTEPISSGGRLQAWGRTVQGEMEAALVRLTGSRQAVVAAGRTDSGVHATGQVAAVTLPSRWGAEELQRARTPSSPMISGLNRS